MTVKFSSYFSEKVGLKDKSLSTYAEDFMDFATTINIINSPIKYSYSI